jgi:hypothetical protein
MAQIVLGIGSSHGPMLTMPPDTWHERVKADRGNPDLFYKGKALPFEEIVERRKSERLERQITPETMAARHAACQKALDRLAAVFAEVKPDVAVLFGNDQMEMFSDLIPAFSVYWGESLPNKMYSAERMAKMPPGIAISVPGHIPPQGAVYKGLPGLGKHILERTIADQFDVASMTKMPGGHETLPHAFGFIYRRIMSDQPVPSVPVVLNTFYPPNQPTVRRCYDFGKSVVKAIQSWESNARVALIASGGLTHWVIDEEVDQTVIDAMRNRRIEKVAALGEETFQAGTSEVKNWIPVAGAMADLGFDMNLVDYVPCYRSEAGTGNAMGFVYWRP